MPSRKFKSGHGSITWDDKLSVNIESLEPRLHAAVTAAVEFHATRAQERLRLEAPWNDQTGNARNGLFAKAIHEPHKHTIVLYHSVPYGIWLEVRWNGRLAVIEPVRNSEGRELMKTMNGMLARLR